jgi:hypothetical protein
MYTSILIEVIIVAFAFAFVFLIIPTLLLVILGWLAYLCDSKLSLSDYICHSNPKVTKSIKKAQYPTDKEQIPNLQKKYTRFN